MSKTKTVLGRTLEEIKTKWAKDHSYENYFEFLDLTRKCDTDHVFIMDGAVAQIAERYAQSQTQELTDWKESMMKVHSELDLQGIGNALGLPLGSSIAPQVLPRVKELQDQNEELVELVQRCWAVIHAYNNYNPTGTGNEILKAIQDRLTKHNHLK